MFQKQKITLGLWSTHVRSLQKLEVLDAIISCFFKNIIAILLWTYDGHLAYIHEFQIAV